MAGASSASANRQEGGADHCAGNVLEEGSGDCIEVEALGLPLCQPLLEGAKGRQERSRASRGRGRGRGRGGGRSRGRGRGRGRGKGRGRGRGRGGGRGKGRGRSRRLLLASLCNLLCGPPLLHKHSPDLLLLQQVLQLLQLALHHALVVLQQVELC
jgi:hypothetical protein